MAMECAAWFTGMAVGPIEGSNTIAEREGSVRVFAYDHAVEIPTDRATGRLAGTRMHKEVIIRAEIDSSTPILYKVLTNGEGLTEVKIVFYKIDDQGDEKPYYEEVLEKAKLVGLQTICPNTLDPLLDRWNHYAEIRLRFEDLTKRFIDGGLEYTDSFTAPR